MAATGVDSNRGVVSCPVSPFRGSRQKKAGHDAFSFIPLSPEETGNPASPRTRAATYSGRLKKLRPAISIQADDRQNTIASFQEEDFLSPAAVDPWDDSDSPCSSPRPRVLSNESTRTSRTPSTQCSPRPTAVCKTKSLPVSTGLPSLPSMRKAKAKTVDLTDTKGEVRLSSKWLSFAEDSWEEVVDAISQEDPQLDWWQSSWARVLVGTPSPICRSVSTRTLHHWVEVYNRWQSLGKWVPGQAPTLVDAYQLQELSAMSMPKVLDLVKVFDPLQHVKVQHTRTAADYQKVRVSMPAFLTVSVLLSNTVSKKQKVRFLLGVFDEDDSQSFDLAEFTTMMCSLFHGIACVFNLANTAKEARMREHLAQQLYSRIASGRSEEGPVPSAILEDWLLGINGYPLSAPFALFLDRFSKPGLDDDPDLFEDGRTLRFSHTSAVELPPMPAVLLESSLLRRSHMQIVRDLFLHCEEARDFGLTYAEAEKAVGTSIDPEFWIGKLRQALDDLETLRMKGTKITWTLFLKKLCPRASPRHLKMFESWVSELHELQVLRGEVSHSRGMLEFYREWMARPPLPEFMRQVILMEYVDSQQRAETRGRKTKEEFVAARCPQQYRFKPGNVAMDQVVRDLLKTHVAREEERLTKMEGLFSATKPAKIQRATSKVLRRAVPQATWRLWNEAVDAMIMEGMGILNPSTLRAVVPWEVADHICAVMRTEGGGSISKQTFLQKMADLGNFRAREEEGADDASSSSEDEAP